MSVDKDDIDGFDGDDNTQDTQMAETPVAGRIEIENESMDETAQAEKSDLFLYKADCLSCSHLIKNVEGVKLKAYRCTSANGNERCPAAHVEISVGANIEKIAKSIYSAHAKLDLAKYARRIARLSKYPASVQRRVMERVEELSLAGKAT